MLNITRDIEIRQKLTVTRGEVRADNGEKRGNYCQKYVQMTHGQIQTGGGSRVGSGDGWDEGEWWGENGYNST